jgi:hypothetical protein
MPLAEGTRLGDVCLEDGYLKLATGSYELVAASTGYHKDLIVKVCRLAHLVAGWL